MDLRSLLLGGLPDGVQAVALGGQQTLVGLNEVGSGDTGAVFPLDVITQLDDVSAALSALFQTVLADVISSVAKTDRYALDGYAAAVYGGVQDYRAKTGENRSALLIAQYDPADDAGSIAEALGITEAQLREKIMAEMMANMNQPTAAPATGAENTEDAPKE